MRRVTAHYGIIDSVVKNKEILLLGVLLVIALMLGFSFWAYYRIQDDTVEVETTQEENTEEAESNAENYSLKMKVTFTNQVYPGDEYQTNPRLKRYVGKVQNTGDKTVNQVGIKVIYLDEDGQGIWEQEIIVNEALKPNYIKEFQFGGLPVPSEWAGKVTYKLTSLQFENSSKIQIHGRMDTGLDRPLPNVLFPIF